MLGFIGILVVFVMVFGGYIAAGGKIGVILKSLPYEMTMIGGAAVGAFLIANDKSVIKHSIQDLVRVFKGPRWTRADYRDLLCLLYELVRVARQNPIALETHIDDPDGSDIFARYPKIKSDPEAVDLICDTLRSAGMNYDDPNQVEDILDKRLDARLHHSLHTAHALQVVADGLPALGIVAAVLGVIKTMASIDQPPEILGGLIGAALVGTFLGVFLAYGFVGPFAGRVKAILEEDHHFYGLIREVLVANLHQHTPALCIEVGRQNTPRHCRPSFPELETALRDLKQAAA